MAEATLIAKFGGKKRAPKFEDEGEPSDSAGDRGKGSGTGAVEENETPDGSDSQDSMPDMDSDTDDMPEMGGDPEQQAVDDLADIVGIGPEDRDDFAAALKSYVSACIASSMAPPDMDMSVGGMPGSDEEAPPGDY